MVMKPSLHMCVRCRVCGGSVYWGVHAGGARESVVCSSGGSRHTLVGRGSKGRDGSGDGTHSPSPGTVSKPFQSRNVSSL